MWGGSWCSNLEKLEVYAVSQASSCKKTYFLFHIKIIKAIDIRLKQNENRAIFIKEGINIHALLITVSYLLSSSHKNILQTTVKILKALLYTKMDKMVAVLVTSVTL